MGYPYRPLGRADFQPTTRIGWLPISTYGAGLSTWEPSGANPHLWVPSYRAVHSAQRERGGSGGVAFQLLRIGLLSPVMNVGRLSATHCPAISRCINGRWVRGDPQLACAREAEQPQTTFVYVFSYFITTSAVPSAKFRLISLRLLHPSAG